MTHLPLTSPLAHPRKTHFIYQPRVGSLLSAQGPPEVPFLHTDEYVFMGALIIREVVQELLGRGLSGAKVLLLAGSR